MSAVLPDPRISADSHMDEPADLWETRLPEKFRDRALRYNDRKIASWRRPGGWDPAARIDDMAVDGICAEVLYPTRAHDIYRKLEDDPELCEASARAYNDWMIDFCSHAPDRLWGQSHVPLWDIDQAIAELERTVKAGMKGVTIWMVPPDELPFESEHYDRFWAACQEMDLPVSMHINTGFGPYGRARDSHRGTFVEAVAFTCGVHKSIAMRALTEMICSGVFDRFPRLKMVIAELEVGWIPFWLEDMDRRFIKNRSREFQLLPSEYFQRQIYATFTQDEVGGYLLAKYGAGNYMWSNDYPHQGCIWPYSDEVIANTLSHLDASTRAKVLAETVATLYNMPIPDPMPRREPAAKETIWERPWIRK